MHTPLTIGAVARLAGVSTTIIRRADAQLAPVRDSAGRRLYARDVVERWVTERAARRAEHTDGLER